MSKSDLIWVQESEGIVLTIKIKRALTDDASTPEWVRKAWLGLRLPLPEWHDPYPSHEHGLRSFAGKPIEPEWIFWVNVRQAIRILRKHNRKAAKWVEENLPKLPREPLKMAFFAADVSLWGPDGEIDFRKTHPAFASL